MSTAPRLSGFVVVTDPDGVTVVLDPDVELPGWAADVVVNPKAWAVAPVAVKGADESGTKPAPRSRRKSE